MLTVSNETNKNYLAKIVVLENLRKHPDADKLQLVDIDFQTVVTGLTAKEGDVYVYFPIECKINDDFLAFTNSFRDSEKNSDPEKKGFFEDNCRVRAMRLRGEKSMGYIVPIGELEAFIGESGLSRFAGERFDTIGNVKLLEKYTVPSKGGAVARQGKEPKVSRLVDGQIHLHVDTEQLERNVHKLNLDDLISISYKTHGTSWWTANVIVKKTLTWFEKILQKLGVNIVDTEYDVVYGSRRTVKNKDMKDPKGKDHFYGYDLWEDIKNQISESIPKNYTLYGEALGYTKDGGFIQKNYDYGVPVGSMRLEVYRITVTNIDGVVTELSTPEIIEFCEKRGLTPSHLFYYGTVRDFLREKNLPETEEMKWRTYFIEHLRKEFNEKKCFMCMNSVWEEGIIVRKESLFAYEAYKLKSFKFLEAESKQLDSGEEDLESAN